MSDINFTGSRIGRPPIGPTIKAAMSQRVVDLLDSITKLMPAFTRDHRDRTQAGLRLMPSPDKTWTRADVVAQVVAAGAPQFAHYVLGQRNAVQLGSPCPLCYGFVEGPHSNRCGYFGPHAELDPHFEERARYVLNVARRASGRLWQLGAPYACEKCGAPCVPCGACGQPAMCGDSWCQPCQPDGRSS